jgi:photosystem II stability/assembly factor-like uncharacterized protein
VSFRPFGAATAWALTSGNGSHDASQAVVRTTDGGAHWSTVTPAGLGRSARTEQIVSTDFVGPDRAWIDDATGSSGDRLVTTDDGGRTWTTVGRAPSGCSLDFVGADTGWCIGILGAAGSEAVTIDRTTTGGRSWREVSNDSPDQRDTPDAIPVGCDKTVEFVSDDDGFASTSFCRGGSGAVYATTDGGARWHKQLSVTVPAGSVTGGESFTPVTAAGRVEAVGSTVFGASASGYKSTRTRSVVHESNAGGRSWSTTVPPGANGGYETDLLTPTVWCGASPGAARCSRPTTGAGPGPASTPVSTSAGPGVLPSCSPRSGTAGI